jgi:hypothetical protein
MGLPYRVRSYAYSVWRISQQQVALRQCRQNLAAIAVVDGDARVLVVWI